LNVLQFARSAIDVPLKQETDHPMKPVIGITPSPIRQNSSAGNLERYAIAACYVNAVLAAGGIPVVLPLQEGNADALLDIVDGLIFSGGADVDPAAFGDTTVHPKTYDIHPLRDRFELDLISRAIERNTPTFCICRGIQILNVACGGTLYQDVPDQFHSPLNHRQQETGHRNHEASHEVEVGSASLLARSYAAATVQVNSYHHQAVRDVAPPLVVSGRSEDGLIEAVELPDRSFVLGVQWHPEMMFEANPEHLRPFTELIAAATARRLSTATV
jgi:putative glutamine amidotransferase